MLITGVSGLLGNNLAFCLKDKYDILGLYNLHESKIAGIQTRKVDLTSLEETAGILREFHPDVIIHCAALSDIDYCEENREMAFKVNVVVTRQLVQLLKARSAKLVYISTDAVYKNANGCALKEDDAITPPNYYGITKYEGELEALKKKDSLILRTNIFGWNIQEKFSIAEWVIHELSNRREIQGFKDVQFSSIYTFEMATILDKAIQKNIVGTYNCASRTSLSKYEFACRLADCFVMDSSLINSISVDDFPFKARRGKNLSLDVDKLEKALGYRCPTIEESIGKFHEDYRLGILDKVKQNTPAVYPQIHFISYGRQYIDEQDIQAVVEVLKSRNLTQGPKVAEFEQAVSEIVQAPYAVAVNSGTAALHIACLAAGIGPGDEVITSPNTFVASANCIVYCGAKPIFADIEPKTYNISPPEIEKKITKKTKAIISVHFAGQSCAMETIQEIAKKYEKKYGQRIYVIEDAAHALGSCHNQTPVGSCRYCDMAVMSFHPVKHITTGEGGIVLTKDRDLFCSLQRLRSHGITSTPEEYLFKDQAHAGDGQVNMWYYEQQFLGYNYRMTDIQSALGISQLRKLPFFIKRRKEIAARYNEVFLNKPFIILPYEKEPGLTNWHLYVLNIDFEALRLTRNAFMRRLWERDIHTQVHYIPVHTQPYYQRKFGYKWGDYPAAEEYYRRGLSIPLYPMMKDQDVEKVITAITQELYAK